MEDTQQQTPLELPTPDSADMSLPVLTREQILKASDVHVELVQVPEWGGSVYVRSLAGTERERYVDSLHVSIGRGKDARREVRIVGAVAKLVALCVCDKNGTRLFDDKDVEALGKKSSAALERVAKVAQRLNGLGDEEEQAVADAGNV